jgi:hypothetical protein
VKCEFGGFGDELCIIIAVYVYDMVVLGVVI